jgi:hypothetical protein
MLRLPSWLASIQSITASRSLKTIFHDPNLVVAVVFHQECRL